MMGCSIDTSLMVNVGESWSRMVMDGHGLSLVDGKTEGFSILGDIDQQLQGCPRMIAQKTPPHHRHQRCFYPSNGGEFTTGNSTNVGEQPENEYLLRRKHFVSGGQSQQLDIPN